MPTRKKFPKPVPAELRPFVAGDRQLYDCDARARKRIARTLTLIAADGTPEDAAGAEEALLRALKGKVKDARSLAATVARSRRRDLLARAWTEMLHEFAERDPPPEEVRPRLEWIVATAPKLQRVPEDEARHLLDAAVAVAVRGIRAWERSRSALLALLALLRAQVSNATERIVSGIVGADAPYSHRASVARDISQRDADAEAHLRQLLVEEAVFAEPEFALYLLGTQPVGRAETLVTVLEQAPNRSQAERSNARVVVEGLCRDNPSALDSYLPALLLLAVVDKQMPLQSQRLVAEALYHHKSGGSYSEPLVGALEAAISRKEEDLREVLGAKAREAEAALAVSEDERRRLATALDSQIALTESLKRDLTRARHLPEHAGRLSVLTPLCAIHQEMVLVLRSQHEQRLQGFARVLESLLVRQGVRLYGIQGQTAPFDPTLHEPVEGTKVEPGTPVEILAAGYELEVEALGTKDNLAKAAVKPVQEQ